MEFIIQVRLRAATELLTNTLKPVLEIATKLALIIYPISTASSSNTTIPHLAATANNCGRIGPILILINNRKD